MFNYKLFFRGIILTILVVIFISIIFTLFDDKIANLILPASEQTNGIKLEWIGFWGNLFGSLIQGIVTAAGIIVTLFIFNEDKFNRDKKEKEQLARAEETQFKNSFGEILSAYDMMIYLTSHYNNLNDYYEGSKFDELTKLAREISQGDIMVRLSIMQGEISSYRRLRVQGLFPYPEDTDYQKADAKIRKNIELLTKFIREKREQHINRFAELTKDDLSKDAIWDEGRILEPIILGEVNITAHSSVSAVVEIYDPKTDCKEKS